jgi:hypothetical protein
MFIAFAAAWDEPLKLRFEMDRDSTCRSCRYCHSVCVRTGDVDLRLALIPCLPTVLEES